MLSSLFCYIWKIKNREQLKQTIRKRSLSFFKRKNETGFHHLYDNYSGALYGVIFRIVQSKEYKEYTEEIIQDVFVKVWNSVHQYDSQKEDFIHG